MISGAIKEPFNIVIKPTRFELRKSTEKYDITNDYISQVVNFIEDNFTSNIDIDSLTKLVPLSRRNLEVKFKESMGTTIYQFIISNRIEYFTHLLMTTNRTLFDLALSRIQRLQKYLPDIQEKTWLHPYRVA